MTETALSDWIGDLRPSRPTENPDQNAFFTPLVNRGLLAWEGEEAERFLQGQLTCDVSALQAGQLTLGACCEPKGRMLASFRLLNTGSGYLMDLSLDLVTSLHEALNKYAMLFRKLQARDASDDFRRLAVWGTGAADALKRVCGELPTEPDSYLELDGIRLLKLATPDAWELWLPPQHCGQWLKDLSMKALLVDPQHWALEEIRAGLGWVNAHSSGMWIPQMLNYSELGAISFNKGCYTGQEIIARLHYRGEQKRRCCRLLASGKLATLPVAGTTIKTSAGKSAGELVCVAPTGPEQAELLAVLQGKLDPGESLDLDGLSLSEPGN